MSYLFHAANVYEKRLLMNSVQIHMQMIKNVQSSNSTNTPELLTANDICHISENDNIKTNSYMFMKNVHGSVAYFKDAFLNLLAMMNNLGPPHIFITFSANEMEWPEVACFLDQSPYQNNISMENMRERVRKDPLMVVLHIERRLRSLIKHVINGPDLPLGGKVVDYFIRREFQQRGCVHFHCLFWMENFPQIAPGNAEQIVEYINCTISTKIPDPEVDFQLHKLVKRLQIHRHYNSYCKRGRFNCRFGFPFRHVRQRTC